MTAVAGLIRSGFPALPLGNASRLMPASFEVEQPWFADAACRTVDPAIFFPDRGGPVSAAKAFCSRCDVRDQCLAYALNDQHIAGVWGGTSERDRAKMRRLAL